MSSDDDSKKDSTQKRSIVVGNRGLQLERIEDMWRFSEMIAKSGLAPKQFTRPEAIIVAVQYGAELGLSPMQSLQGLAVINGRVGMFGDMARALCEGSQLCEYIADNTIDLASMPLDKDDTAAVVVVKRVDRANPCSPRSFSISDAKQAGLWGRQGPWTQYPRRMLYYRALGFALRDGFPDVLRGITIAEELQDYPRNGLQSGATVPAENLEQLADELTASGSALVDK